MQNLKKKLKQLIAFTLAFVMTFTSLQIIPENTEEVKAECYHAMRYFSDTAYMLNGKTWLLRKCNNNCGYVTSSDSFTATDYIKENKMYIMNEDYNEIGEATCIYGPYIWIPKGTYDITLSYTTLGWNTKTNWDVVRDTATGFQKFLGFSHTSDITYEGCSITNIKIDNTNKTLSYTLTTDGMNADYEFRTAFELQEDKKTTDLMTSLTIKRRETNTITFNANGGTLNGASTGTLTTTSWGGARTASVPVPTRSGYIFAGWTTYKAIDNGTTLVGSANDVTIWDASGNICSDATVESSYINYTVYAQWAPEPVTEAYTLTVNPNGGTWGKYTSFITSLYENALGRKSDGAGLYNWAAALAYGTETPVSVAKGIYNSAEYAMKNTSNTEFMTSLYRVFMGREPDAGGLANWVSWLDTGVYSRDFAIETFAGTEEAQIKYANYSSEATVALIIPKGNSFPIENPTRNGYTFTGWTPENTVVNNSFTMGSSNVTITAQWTPNLTQYKVNHFRQKLDGTYPTTPDDTETVNNIPVDTVVKPTPKKYTGFEIPQTTSVKVKADGSTVINYYYPRQIHTLTIKPNGGTWNGSADDFSVPMSYGADYPIGDPVREGYTFEWDLDGEGSTLNNRVFIMGTEDAILTANWNAKNVKYTVNHWTQNIGGNATIYNNKNYTLYNTEPKSGLADSTITVSNLKKSITGFTYKVGLTNGATVSTTTVLPDGSRVIDLYYTRNKYNVNLSAKTGISSVTGGGTYYYGEEVTIEATVLEGYTWYRWYGTVESKLQKYTFTMPSRDLNLPAYATPKQYTLTVYPNGSEEHPATWNDTSEPSQFTINCGTSKSVTSSSVTRPGYILDPDNPYTLTGEGSTYDGYTFVMGTEDATITFNWKLRTSTLQVNPNGGTWENSSDNTKITLNVFETRYIEDPIRDGYTFKGWTTNFGSGPVNSTFNTETKIFTMGMPNAILIANWEKTPYTLTMDLDGGTWTDSNNTYTDIATFSLYYLETKNIHNKPTKEGYNFVKWEIVEGEENENKFIVSNGLLFFQMGYSDATIKAIWETNTCKVSFDYNEPDFMPEEMTDNDVLSKDIVYNSAYGTLPNPKLTGYRFLGWYTEENGGNEVTSETIVKTTSDHTLYAHWEAIEYTVTFDYMKPDEALFEIENNTITSKKISIGNVYGTLPTPTLKGYTFKGWYTETTYNRQIFEDTMLDIFDNHTLYAKWEPIEIRLVFNYTLPSEAPIENTEWMIGNDEKFRLVQYYTAYGELPTPKTPGYNFIGWSTEPNTSDNHEDGINRVSATTIMTSLEEVNIYAIWNPITIGDPPTPPNPPIPPEDPNPTYDNRKTGVIFDYSENESGTTEFKTHDIENNTEVSRTVEYANKYNYMMTDTSWITKSLPNPKLKGWTFLGWNLTGNIYGAPYGDPAGNSAYPNEYNYLSNHYIVSTSQVKTWVDHTLKAVWEPNKYKITVNTNLKNINTEDYLIVDATYDMSDVTITVPDIEVQYKATFNVNNGECAVTEAISIWEPSGYIYNSEGTGIDNTTLAYYVDDINKNNIISNNEYNNSYNVIINKIVNRNYHPENVVNSDFTYIPVEDSKAINVRNLTSQKDANVRLYTTWKPGEITLPTITRDNSEFLGWFTVDQNDPTAYAGANSYKLYYIGMPGDKICLGEDVTLYAWWNKKPVMIDILEGEFWEGQDVSYEELLSLVTVQDYEDDYSNKATDAIDAYYEQELINVGLQEEGIKEEIRKIENGKVNIYGDAVYDALADLNNTLELLNQQRQALQEQRFKDLDKLKNVALEIRINNVTYADGTVIEMDYKNDIYTITNDSNSDVNAEIYGISNFKLDTATSKIGEYIITFEATDNGFYCGDKQLKPITMEYIRHGEINYNYAPLLEVHSFSEMSNTELTSLTDTILEMQGVRDSEDSLDNAPWWTSYEANVDDEGNSLLFDENDSYTHVKMNYDNLFITGIAEINFASSFEYDTDYDGTFINKTTVEEFKNTWLAPEASNKGVETSDSNDNGVYNKGAWVDKMYQDAKAKGLWQYITSIEVTIDAKDQWGKYCSDRVSQTGAEKGVTTNPQITPGLDPNDPNKSKTQVNPNPNNPEKPYDNITTYQTPEERTVSFVLVNPEVDDNLLTTRVWEDVRYINQNYLNTVSGSDWDTKENKNTLKRMLALQAMQNSPNWVDVIEPTVGTYTTNSGSTITLTVYDYGQFVETEESWQAFLNTYGLTEPTGYERE